MDCVYFFVELQNKCQIRKMYWLITYTIFPPSAAMCFIYFAEHIVHDTKNENSFREINMMRNKGIFSCSHTLWSMCMNLWSCHFLINYLWIGFLVSVDSKTLIIKRYMMCPFVVSVNFKALCNKVVTTNGSNKQSVWSFAFLQLSLSRQGKDRHGRHLDMTVIKYLTFSA